MDTADNREFIWRLVTLAELFDVKLSPQRQALYFEALRDLPLVTVCRGLNTAAKACTFMPKPAEIRSLAIGTDEDQAERAWVQFKDAMRLAGGYTSLALQDGALAETIVAMFGSWPAACSTELSPEMWASKRKEFGRLYHIYRDRDVSGPKYLLGICEQQNAGIAEWKRFNPVALITETGIKQLDAAEADAYRAQLAGQRHEMTRIGEGDFGLSLKDDTA